IPEELGFDQRIQDRAAINRHKRLLSPGAQVMDRPSDEFLSCARLTFDEDREWRVGHLADLLDNLLHLRAGADQPRYRALDDPVRLGLLQHLVLTEPEQLETASFACRILPSRSETNTGSGALAMMMSASRDPPELTRPLPISTMPGCVASSGGPAILGPPGDRYVRGFHGPSAARAVHTTAG